MDDWEDEKVAFNVGCEGNHQKRADYGANDCDAIDESFIKLLGT